VSATPPELGPGYVAERVLARGGMGVVWAGRDLVRGAPCAVKLLAIAQAPPDFVARFAREVTLAERLAGHPGLVLAHDSGVTPKGEPFCVMELVAGSPLDERLEEGLSRRVGVQVVRDVADAVAFAHAKGVIHRDLKPQNILCEALPGGALRARLLDLGVAKACDSQAQLTHTGDQLGSPSYMAPEQVTDSKRTDERTDVYGLGVTLWHVLTGQQPFQGETVGAILKAVATGALKRAHEVDPTVDRALSDACAKAMALDPASRWPSVTALRDALDAWLAASATRVVARADPQADVGRLVAGKYELVSPLGQGGHGVVWRAKQRLDGREVALKRILPARVGDPDARARFLREVATAQAFVHKHAVVVRDYGEEPDGALYLTMDLVAGETLAARAARLGGRLPPAEAVRLVVQLLEALGEAHAQGIVHRDLKAENVMVEETSAGPKAMVLDFGIAKALGDGARAGIGAEVTEAGRVVGTLSAMSPEQAAGEPVDARSDLWSVGALLYGLLAGRPPFQAESPQKHLWKLSTEAAPPLERLAPDVPLALCRVVHQALERDPARRPGSAGALRASLEVVLRDLSRQPPRSARLTPSTPRSGLTPSAPTPRPPAPGTTTSLSASLDPLLGPAPPPALGVGPGPAVAFGGVVLLLVVVIGALAFSGPGPTTPPRSTATTPPPTSTPRPPPPTSVVAVSLEPEDGAVVGRDRLDLRGRAGPGVRVVRVGDREARVAPDGSFVLPGLRLDPGENLVQVALDGDPGRTRTVRLVSDPDAPRLELEAPADGALVTSRLTVSGQAWDQTLVGVTVDGRAAALDQDGRFALEVDGLAPGGLDLERQVVVVASDRAGHATTVTRRVRRAEGEPEKASPLPPGLEPGPEPGTARCPKDGSLLVWVPPGSFVMGSPEDGGVRREVRLSRGCWLGRTEVTWAQYERFCAATGRVAPSRSVAPDGLVQVQAQDDHPVFDVTWADATDYADWAGLRLPTEAEWERAATGAGDRRWPWGDAAPEAAAANVAGRQDGFAFLAPVGSFPAGRSPYGALDLAGNVDEWVHDWFARQDDPEPAVDPRGPGRGAARVTKGGSWATPLAGCRGSGRTPQRPGYAGLHLGFRVAR
jgi:serine/threonine protein kinase/formylglycine-generating enzyme required for sulfatase activity